MNRAAAVLILFALGTSSVDTRPQHVAYENGMKTAFEKAYRIDIVGDIPIDDVVLLEAYVDEVRAAYPKVFETFDVTIKKEPLPKPASGHEKTARAYSSSFPTGPTQGIIILDTELTAKDRDRYIGALLHNHLGHLAVYFSDSKKLMESFERIPVDTTRAEQPFVSRHLQPFMTMHANVLLSTVAKIDTLDSTYTVLSPRELNETKELLATLETVRANYPVHERIALAIESLARPDREFTEHQNGERAAARAFLSSRYGN